MSVLTPYLRDIFATTLGAPYVSLHTTAGEITALAGYARRTATWTTSAGTSINTNLISFPVAGADWGTIKFLGGWDSISGGGQYWQVPLDTSYFVKSGDQLVFDIGSIRVVIV